MKTLSIDIETYSDVPLQKTGVYRYVESPDFEILLFAYSVDNQPVQVIDLACGEQIPKEILLALEDECVIGLNLAQERTLDRRHIACAVAAAALLFGRALGLAGTIAVIARGKTIVADRLFAAERRLLERHRKGNGHIATATALATAASATTGAAAKERREQVVHAHATKDIVDIDIARAAGAVRSAVTVIVGTLLLVRKNGIGLVELFELGLSLGVVRNVRVYGTGLL